MENSKEVETCTVEDTRMRTDVHYVEPPRGGKRKRQYLKRD